MDREKKQTIINLFAKVVSYGTTLIISFFLTPYLVSKFGKETYSFYPIANNFVNYMSVVTIALNSMAARFITISLTKGDKIRANTYFVSILAGNVILSLFMLIPITFIVIFLQNILNIPMDLVFDIKLLFVLVFLSMLVNMLTNVLGVAVFSQNRLELSSISECIIGISRVLLYIILFIFFTPNIVYVGVVSLCVAVLTMIFHLFFTKKLLPFIKIKRSFFDFEAIKEVTFSGIWNSVNQIGGVLLLTVGLMLANKLYGAKEGGDYAIALNIPTFLNGIVSMLSSVFMPGLTIKYANGNSGEIIRHVRMTQNVIGMIINIPIAIFIAVGVDFFSLWTPSVNPYKLQALSVLSISYLLVTSVTWPLSNLNIVMNKVKVPAVVMLGTGIANIILVFIFYFYSDMKIYSIPLCQLILFIINRCLFLAAYSAKMMEQKWYIFYPAIFKNLISAMLLLIISLTVNQIVSPDNWVSLIAECVVLGIVGIVINLVLIFEKKKIKIFTLKNK